MCLMEEISVYNVTESIQIVVGCSGGLYLRVLCVCVRVFSSSSSTSRQLWGSLYFVIFIHVLLASSTAFSGCQTRSAWFNYYKYRVLNIQVLNIQFHICNKSYIIGNLCQPSFAGFLFQIFPCKNGLDSWHWPCADRCGFFGADRLGCCSGRCGKHSLHQPLGASSVDEGSDRFLLLPWIKNGIPVLCMSC